jgi:D-tyrosyl-tRNA(Tyr) deacylase
VRALLQRVHTASVSVEGKTIGEIGPGLLILLCAMQGDTEAEADLLTVKITKLRIFEDTAGKMNLSLKDTEGAALIVSQFTLAADTSRGNRPGFSTAAPPESARHLYDYFSKQMQNLGITVANGQFGADMDVSLCNAGPVTIWLDTAN